MSIEGGGHKRHELDYPRRPAPPPLCWIYLAFYHLIKIVSEVQKKINKFLIMAYAGSIKWINR